MRIGGVLVCAALGILIGVGIGFLYWGAQLADLNRQVQEQRSELNYRISELETRVKSAEDRANQEAATRRVLEEELHRVRPLK